MDRFWKAVQWILDKMRVLGAACLVGMTFLTCADVVGRFFRHPVFGSVEIVSFMAVLAVSMSLPYTHQMKGHIGVEILVRLFPPRFQAVLDICTGLLSFVLFALISWRLVLYGRTIQRSGEVSMNLELPEYAVIYMVGFCFLVFTLIIAQDVVHNIRKLRDR